MRGWHYNWGTNMGGKSVLDNFLAICECGDITGGNIAGDHCVYYLFSPLFLLDSSVYKFHIATKCGWGGNPIWRTSVIFSDKTFHLWVNMCLTLISRGHNTNSVLPSRTLPSRTQRLAPLAQ